MVEVDREYAYGLSDHHLISVSTYQRYLYYENGSGYKSQRQKASYIDVYRMRQKSMNLNEHTHIDTQALNFNKFEPDLTCAYQHMNGNGGGTEMDPMSLNYFAVKRE